MTIIMKGEVESRLNARERRRLKRAGKVKDFEKRDNVDKAIRFANEARCKPDGVKEVKNKVKWYQENESGNYFHAKQPRHLGEKPLDKVRYH